MRLRRHKDEAGSATTGGDPGTPGTAPARRRGNEPAAGEISSVGVAIMPGMPLPDWVTAAALPDPTAPATPPPSDPAWPPVDARMPAEPLVAAYPQIDPAYEGLLAAAAAAQAAAAAAQPVASVPRFPQIDPAYEAALAAAAVPVAAPTSGAELPPPDPAQWSEQPAGVVVWGPIPTPAAPVPAGAVPMQAPAFDPGPHPEPVFAAAEPTFATAKGVFAAAAPTSVTVNPLATLPPPTGPAYDVESVFAVGPAADQAAPPEDAADLDAPDLDVPADEWSAPEPAAELLPEGPEPELPMWAPVAATGYGVDQQAWQLDVPAAGSASGPVDEPPSWFVTDVADDAPPSPTSGAGQYGWLFQPDEPAPASETRQADHAPSATSWFDPAAADQPSWGATAATVPVQWAGGAFDDAPATPLTQAQAAAPALAAAAAAAPGLDPISPSPAPVAAPVAPPPVAAPVAPPPAAEGVTRSSVTAPPPSPASVTAAPVPIVPSQPSPSAVMRTAPAAAALVGPPARPTTPESVAAATPEPQQRRSRLRWLILAGIVALVAAAVAVSLFVYPGFLKSDPAAPATPAVATPATAGGLTRTASADGAVGPFRRTAAALRAGASSQYATYASEAGTTATVWDSNGAAASPAAMRAAYDSSGGRQLGPLVDVPAGPRGGSMACAAASATRTVCFWAGTGVAGASDIRGLARTEAGALAAKMRVALEQPA